MNERKWQTTLQDGLKREGWAWQHIYRLKTASGQWRTSTTARGWPDLMAFREGWVLAIECKTGVGSWKPEPGQLDWLERVAEIPTGRAWLLPPNGADWQDIANWLNRPEEAPRRLGFTEGGILARVTRGR
jgi:Holliday junction resolvase